MAHRAAADQQRAAGSCRLRRRHRPDQFRCGPSVGRAPRAAPRPPPGPSAHPSSWKPWPVQAPQNQVRAGPGSTEPALRLDRRRGRRPDGCSRTTRPGSVLAPDLAQRIERDDHRLGPRHRLQPVEQIVQDHARALAARVAGVLVVPRRPRPCGAFAAGASSCAAPRGWVVADRAQHRAPRRAGVGAQQPQRLVRWHGQHHLVVAAPRRRRRSPDRRRPRAGASPHAPASTAGTSGRPRGDGSRSGAPLPAPCRCGRSLTCSSPWLWQKRIIVAIGNFSICSVGQDQMQPIIGRKYQRRKVSEKRWHRESRRWAAPAAPRCRCAPARWCSS